MEDSVHIQIEQYLDNLLTKEERQHFEEACEKDPAIQEQLKQTIYARMAIQQTGMEDFKAMIQTADPTVSTPRWTFRLVAAAIAVLILFFAASRLLREKTYSTQELYTAYFGEVAIPITSDRGSDTWQQIHTFIDAGAYHQAIPLLQQLNMDSTFAYPMQATLYLAQCQLKNGNSSEALQTIEVIPPDDPTYGTDKLWLMALVSLAQNEPERARLILNQLLESKTYGNRVTEMLDKWEE